MVVDIKQHKSQFNKFKLYHYTVSKVLLTLCNGHRRTLLETVQIIQKFNQ